LCFSLYAPATTETYPLSLHDALPICGANPGHLVGGDLLTVAGAADDDAERAGLGNRAGGCIDARAWVVVVWVEGQRAAVDRLMRSEEHTSELQSPCNLVCRLLLEKKK